MKSQCLRNIKKLSFPHRTVDIWNRLSEEIVAAENVHKLKEKQDKNRDRSLGAPLEPCKIQLDKHKQVYTHLLKRSSRFGSGGGGDGGGIFQFKQRDFLQHLSLHCHTIQLLHTEREREKKNN
ncbi:hypothetical protein E2C01_076421 [Portunus trituberculatus]|uniref:Uncharacterized protein n=1 Tax=Portunus trituberculatus TaxID=210409 RepID=A0A5B7ILZ9_PORTR|nr:hypothetical protein [Portunus trituberculatus]